MSDSAQCSGRAASAGPNARNDGRSRKQIVIGTNRAGLFSSSCVRHHKTRSGRAGRTAPHEGEDAMSLRTFTDSNGQQWEAYDVVPRAEERRRYDRRSGETKVEIVEDRRDTDRRVTVGRSEHITAKAGWLCFESNDERRRLTPIPEDWARC